MKDAMWPQGRAWKEERTLVTLALVHGVLVFKALQTLFGLTGS
jgi:hypothetical protein